MINVNKRVLKVFLLLVVFIFTFNFFLSSKPSTSVISAENLKHVTDYLSSTTEEQTLQVSASDSDSLKLKSDDIEKSGADVKNEILASDSEKSAQSSTSSTSSSSKNKPASSVNVSEQSSDVSKQEVGAKGVIYKDKSDDSKDADTAEYDAASDFNDLVETNTVILFSKTYCPFSKGMKDLLDKYKILPALKIVELDTHKNGASLQDYVAEKTGRKTVPNLVIPSKGLSSLGGFDDFKDLTEKQFLTLVNDACGKTCSFESSKE